MLLLIYEATPDDMENGLVKFFLQKIINNSIFQRDLPTDFLFCLIQQNSVINVQTSIIREMKADLPGTTQKSVLNGQNSSENILAALLQKDII